MFDKLLSKVKLRRKNSLIIFILVIPLFLIIIISLTILSSMFYDSFQNNVNNSNYNLKNTFDFFKERTLVYSEIISKVNIIQNGIYINDEEDIVKYIYEAINRFKLDFISIYNKDGKLIAENYSNKTSNINKVPKIPHKKIKQENINSISIIEKENNIILYGISPINSIINREEVLGYVYSGYFLNNNFAHNIKNISGINLIIVNDNTIIASSLNLEKTKKLTKPITK
ncbi:MAG: hypothetical protein ACOCV8_03730, partial [Spirochaetota bacterium]